MAVCRYSYASPTRPTPRTVRRRAQTIRRGFTPLYAIYPTRQAAYAKLDSKGRLAKDPEPKAGNLIRVIRVIAANMYTGARHRTKAW